MVANLYKTLSEKNIIIPYVQNAITSDKWPTEFRIPIRTHGSLEDDWFHPSIDSYPDARYLYYRLHPEEKKKLRPEQRRSVENELSPLLGTVFHVVIQQKLKVTGFIGDEHIEVPLVNEEVHGKGHLDFVFPNHPIKGKDIVVDIKTASPESFDNLFAPRKQHIYQLQPYMDFYGKQTNQVIDEGVLFYIRMGRPFTMKEFRIDRNEEILTEIYTKWDYVRNCIALNTPPKAKCHNCTKDSDIMERCPAKNPCLETW